MAPSLHDVLCHNVFANRDGFFDMSFHASEVAVTILRVSRAPN